MNFKYQISNTTNKKINSKLILIGNLIFVLFVVFIVFPQKIFAENFSAGIYPPILQIHAEPPASVNNKITIINQTDQNASYNITLVPFTAGDSLNGQPEFDEGLIPIYQDLFSKTQIMDGNSIIKQVNLAPKQKKILNLHIGLTDNSALGDFYFSVVFASNSNEQNKNGSFTGARGGVATNVLLSAGPETKAQGKIENFSAPKFITKGPVNFNLNIANTGTSYFAVKGNIIVKNMFNQTIGNIDLVPVNVLSKSNRLIPSKNNLYPDKPKAVWNEKFLLGFYKADATVALSKDGPLLQKQISFFAFPMEGLIAIIICIILFMAIIKRVKQKSDNVS